MHRKKHIFYSRATSWISSTKKQTRLIKPAKPEVVSISKVIIQGIVDKLKGVLGYNLWINTYSAIKWFEGIQGKDEATFIQFDIVDFYPSITEDIPNNPIEFATSHINIPPQDI